VVAFAVVFVSRTVDGIYYLRATQPGPRCCRILPTGHRQCTVFKIFAACFGLWSVAAVRHRQLSRLSAQGRRPNPTGPAGRDTAFEQRRLEPILAIDSGQAHTEGKSTTPWSEYVLSSSNDPHPPSTYCSAGRSRSIVVFPRAMIRTKGGAPRAIRRAAAGSTVATTTPRQSEQPRRWRRGNPGRFTGWFVAWPAVGCFRDRRPYTGGAYLNRGAGKPKPSANLSGPDVGVCGPRK